jgi:choice-of-anchor C domain-containing protein
MSVLRSRILTASLATATAVLASAGAAHAVSAGAPQVRPRAVTIPADFADGSFEAPRVPAGGFTTYNAGQSIGPWLVTKGSVDLVGGGFWGAAEGDQSVDLNGITAGGVAQTFATNPGTKYRVTYSVAANTAGGPTVKTGRVLVNGLDAQAFSFDSTGKSNRDMGYSAETFEFTATLPQTTLTFDSTTVTAAGGPSAYGPVLDAVTVTPECCNSCGTAAPANS